MCESKFTCAFRPPHAHRRVAAGERTHEIHEEQEKQVFVGLYLGSNGLETHSEPAGVPVLTASVGSWG